MMTEQKRDINSMIFIANFEFRYIGTMQQARPEHNRPIFPIGHGQGLGGMLSQKGDGFVPAGIVPLDLPRHRRGHAANR